MVEVSTGAAGQGRDVERKGKTEGGGRVGRVAEGNGRGAAEAVIATLAGRSRGCGPRAIDNDHWCHLAVGTRPRQRPGVPAADAASRGRESRRRDAPPGAVEIARAGLGDRGE
jgi:hypothetical protein